MQVQCLRVWHVFVFLQLRLACMHINSKEEAVCPAGCGGAASFLMYIAARAAVFCDLCA
jgi:hypothetical protein